MDQYNQDTVIKGKDFSAIYEAQEDLEIFHDSLKDLCAQADNLNGLEISKRAR